MLFTVVSSFHHEGVGEPFNNRAIHFLETSLLISASGEWDVDLRLGSLHVDVGLEGQVLACHVLISPSSVELDLGGVLESSFFDLEVGF